jgi:hypothetical protein
VKLKLDLHEIHHRGAEIDRAAITAAVVALTGFGVSAAQAADGPDVGTMAAHKSLLQLRKDLRRQQLDPRPQPVRRDRLAKPRRRNGPRYRRRHLAVQGRIGSPGAVWTTSKSPPSSTSTGTTTDACTASWNTSRPPSTKHYTR